MFPFQKVFLITYFILNLATMFTIQTAVTIVTAGLASSLFGITDNMVIWSLIITITCYIILLLGKYKILDKMIKIIILILAITTIFSTGVASINSDEIYSFKQIFPSGSGLVFLVALDVIFQSFFLKDIFGLPIAAGMRASGPFGKELIAGSFLAYLGLLVILFFFNNKFNLEWVKLVRIAVRQLKKVKKSTISKPQKCKHPYP